MLIAALGLALAVGCDGFGRGEVDVSTLDAPVAEPTWDGEIAVMLDIHCVECHGEQPTHGAPDTVRLDTFDGAVAAAELSWSRMVDTPTRPMPTLDRPDMNDAELETFENWLITGMPR